MTTKRQADVICWCWRSVLNNFKSGIAGRKTQSATEDMQRRPPLGVRITAGEMAKAMELDDQVDKVIISLKRKRDLKEDEASSSNGAAR